MIEQRLTNEEIACLNNRILNIYYEIIIEENYVLDKSRFMDIISDEIQNVNQLKFQIFNENPNNQYALDLKRLLVENIAKRINFETKEAIDLAEKVNDFYQNTTDIAMVLAPYLMLNLNIKADEIFLFVELFFVASKIIANKVTNCKIKEIEELIRIKDICGNNINYIEKSGDSNNIEEKKKMLQANLEVKEKVLEEIKNIKNK